MGLMRMAAVGHSHTHNSTDHTSLGSVCLYQWGCVWSFLLNSENRLLTRCEHFFDIKVFANRQSHKFSQFHTIISFIYIFIDLWDLFVLLTVICSTIRE